MIYQANKRQFGALEGLAHWCAEYYYTLERFGADDTAMPGEGSPAREAQRYDIIGNHYTDNIFCL